MIIARGIAGGRRVRRAARRVCASRLERICGGDIAASREPLMLRYGSIFGVERQAQCAGSHGVPRNQPYLPGITSGKGC